MVQRMPIRGPYAHEIPPEPFTRGPYAQGNGFGASDLSAKGLIMFPWEAPGNDVNLDISNTATADGEIQLQFICRPASGVFTANVVVPFTSGDSGPEIVTAAAAIIEAAYPGLLTCTPTLDVLNIALVSAGTIDAPPFASIA